MNRYKLKELSLKKLEYGSGAAACKYDGSTRYVRITDIDNEGNLGDDIVSPNSVEEKYVLHDGDILFARTGATVGKTYLYRINDGRCIYAGFLIRLVPNINIIRPEYLYYYTKSPTYKRVVQNSMKVVAQPNINAKQYGELELNVPTLKVQDEIILKLGLVNSIIILRKRELQKLDQLIKARFVEMFGTVHNNVFQFAECTLESISDEFFAGGDKPADCTTERDEAHPYPVFANGYENEGLQGYSTKCRVTQPAVTISARGTIGYCFIREAGFTPVVRLVTIVPNNKVSPVFLKYAIDTMDIKSSGTGQAQLTVPDFKRERIIVPPVELQSQFASFVSQIDKSKAVIQKSLDEAQLLFDSLMQQYFG